MVSAIVSTPINHLIAIALDKAIQFIQVPLGKSIFLALILLALLALLLSLGRRLELAVRLERLGIPTALIAGLVGLTLGPYGPLPILPQSVADIWVQLPTPLLTLVFATLLLGRPLPNGPGLLKPVLSQSLLGFLIGFGQYVVGGMVVIFFLIPFYGVDPLMGCLIEVGFEGGHGAAAVMGKSFDELGFSGGQDLGLAMATVGLLASTVLGSGLIVIARFKGWVASEFSDEEVNNKENKSTALSERIKQLILNLSFPGIAILIGLALLNTLKFLSSYFGDTYQQVINAFPVFPLALLGSLLVRLFLERFNKIAQVSEILQREVGTISTDLLITTAIASLDLPLLRENWIPITALSVAGLTWNLIVMLLLGKVILKNEWFERSITEFGNATGVAASGLLLLRLADPRNSTIALPVFSIKQLLLQPLLSGGLITVLAPIAIKHFGLISWTEITGIITIIFIIFSIYSQK